MGSLSNHPYIVTVYASAFTSDHRPCIVMDLFEHGHYLTKIKQEGPLTLQELLSLGIRMSGALEAAHRQGIIHGDVKPQNIFRSEFGFPALGDFGIATLGGGWSGRVLSLSVDYAAPELIERGTEATSPLSDQYSLGATLYTLATGRRPFRTTADETPSQTLSRIRSQSPPLLPDRFPPALVAAVRNTMARNPQDRYPDLATFAATLSHIEHQLGLQPTDIIIGTSARLPAHTTDRPQTPPPDADRESVTVIRPTTQPHNTPTPQPEKPGRRPRWLIPTLATAAVGIVAAAFFVLNAPESSEPSKPTAAATAQPPKEPDPLPSTEPEGTQPTTTTTTIPTTTEPTPTTTAAPATTAARPDIPVVTASVASSFVHIEASWSVNDNGSPISQWEVRIDGANILDTFRADDWPEFEGEFAAGEFSWGWELNPGKHQVSVRALNSSGWSEWGYSNVVTIELPVIPPPPSSVWVADVGETWVTVAWDPVPGAYNYDVDYWGGDIYSWGGFETDVTSGSYTTTYQATGLRPNKTYTFAVRSCNDLQQYGDYGELACGTVWTEIDVTTDV